MPKLKTQKFWYYLPDMQTCQITCHINSEGDFYIPCDDFPKEILNMCIYTHPKIDIGRSKRFNFKENKRGFLLENGVGEFESVVKKIIQSAEDNYKNSNKEKVILFKMKLQGEMQKAEYVEKTNDEDAYWQQRKVHEEISSFSDDRHGTGILSLWEVFYRVKNLDDDGYYYYDLDNRKVGRSRDYSEWKTIIWTEQREDWFKGLDESLKKIIRSAENFRDANPELIEQFIDTAVGSNILEFKPKEVIEEKPKKKKTR